MNEELKVLQEKQLKQMHIQTAILAVMLALIVAVGAIVVFVAGSITRQVKQIDMGKINEMIVSMETVTSQLDDVDLSAAAKALQEAAGTLGEADISAITDGIKALAGAADNLQGLDMERLNELIASMEQVTAQMEKTTAVFAKFFGR